MKNLILENETYYTFNNETNRFESSGELTGNYTEIQEFKHNLTKLCMISCNDTKEIFIIR
jgi:hypothetical protein